MVSEPSLVPKDYSVINAMRDIAYSWLFDKLKNYLEFAWHNVIIAKWFLLLITLAVAVPTVLWALQAKISSVGIPSSFIVPLLGWETPLWPSMGVAVLIAGVVIVARYEWMIYRRGPVSKMNVVFAGFFSPSGSEGNFISGGAARSLEHLFLEIMREEFSLHRLNTLGVRIAGSDNVLHIGVIDHRPSPGFVGTHDFGSFSELTGEWSGSQLGVVWGTLGVDGRLDTLEILINPRQLHGGPLGLMALDSIKRFADDANLPTRAKLTFVARVLAALWAQSFCNILNIEERRNEALQIAADSRRIVERSLEELGQSHGSEVHPAIEDLRRTLLPIMIRTQASLTWFTGDKHGALNRMLDALKIWPLGPMRTRSEFRTFYEARYAFEMAAGAVDFRQFLEEDYDSPTEDLEKLAEQFGERALHGLPVLDLPLFVDWIAALLEEGVDLESFIDRWFSELAEHHPEEPFVLALWGDALRLVAVHKYGSELGRPDIARLDAAIEKFTEAYSLQPEIKIFAARIWGIGLVAASGLANTTEEGQRRRDDLAAWGHEAREYWRDHLPEMLKNT